MAERLEEINDKIRAQLFRKGTTGLSGVARVFRQADFNGNKKLDVDEFEDALSFAGVFLSASELNTLFKQYDDNGDGNIGYEEFINGLAPPLTGARLATVQAAFKKVDADGSNSLTARDLAGVYNAKAHPDVVQGKKSEAQVMEEFLGGFEGDAAGDRKGDGVVTFKEFLDYYTDLSGSIPSDEYFVTMMARVWDVSKANTTSKVRTLCSVLREKSEQRAKGNKNATDTLRGTFKFFDEDESGAVGPREFAKALERFGIPLSKQDLQLFFDAFDEDGSGAIAYDEFVARVFGEELNGK